MTMLFEELKEELKKWYEPELIELLDLTSNELVDTFSELIYDKQEEIRQKIGDQES